MSQPTPLKRISSRDSDEVVPLNWYIITKCIIYKNLEVQCGGGIGIRKSIRQGRIHINPRYQRIPNDTIVQPPLFSTSRDVLVVMVLDDRPSTSPHAPNRIDRYTRFWVVSWHPRLLFKDPLQKKTFTKSRIPHLDTNDRIGDQKCL